MPFIPVPNTVQVEVVYELDSQIVENTLYYTHTAPFGETEITQLLNDVRTAIESELLPLLGSALKLVRLIGTLLDAVDAIAVTINVSPPVAGGNTTQVLPNNVSYAISFKSASRGRSARGRNFIAGITEDGVNVNVIGPTFRSDLVAAYEQIGGAGADDGWAHVIVSRFSNGSPRTAGVTFPVITYTTFDDIVDSQRRRLPGRGR